MYRLAIRSQGAPTGELMALVEEGLKRVELATLPREFLADFGSSEPDNKV